MDRQVVAAAALAVAAAGTLYFLFSDLNFNVTDEGFLWYGVIHTRAGEVPIRDFQAYEPGRYYWSAAWSHLFGPGILGLRATLALTRAIGLFLGLLVCRRATDRVPALAFCATVLALWTFPDHKVFEATIAMAAVWIGVRLLEEPSTRRLFEAGAFAGLAAWFGRNHGLYCGLALVSMVALLRFAGRMELNRPNLLSFVLGGVGASAPLWMLWFLPGFASAFWTTLVINVTQGVNTPLPYPWPWSTVWRDRHGFDLLAQIGTTVMFILPLLLYPILLVVALRTPRERQAERAPMIAAAFVGVFYMHHVSVRSDVSHLAQAIHPLLILLLVTPACLVMRPALRLAIPAALGALTLAVALAWNPSLAQFRPGPGETFVAHEIAGDRLRLPASLAAQMTGIEEAVGSRLREGEALFVAPSSPGLYPIFGRKSPDYWIYFLWSATETAQRLTIDHLESSRVAWALVADEAFYGNDSLRFRNTNPRVWEYLAQRFEIVEDVRLPPNRLLLHRRAP